MYFIHSLISNSVLFNVQSINFFSKYTLILLGYEIMILKEAETVTVYKLEKLETLIVFFVKYTVIGLLFF